MSVTVQPVLYLNLTGYVQYLPFLGQQFDHFRFGNFDATYSYIFFLISSKLQ